MLGAVQGRWVWGNPHVFPVSNRDVEIFSEVTILVPFKVFTDQP